MDEQIRRLETQVANLRRDFIEHRHTGLDSKIIDLSDQIQTLGELTEEDDAAVDDTYGQDEADVINNLRVRVGQLEAVLQAFGILQ